MTKAKSATALKTSPVKATTPTRIPNPYSLLPKKNAEGKKNSHNIIPLVDNDGTPYGWAFENIFNAKDFVKELSNRNNALIFLGGLECKAFSNLTTRWVKSLLVVSAFCARCNALGSACKFMNVNQIAVLFCWVVVLLCTDEFLCYHFDNYCAYVVCVVSVLIIAEW